jgi:hypothetical protein
MRRSLVLALLAVGGGASYAAGIGKVGVEFPMFDPSTWRWRVSSILDEQRNSSQSIPDGKLGRTAYGQRHERYSPLGSPETARTPP